MTDEQDDVAMGSGGRKPVGSSVLQTFGLLALAGVVLCTSAIAARVLRSRRELRPQPVPAQTTIRPVVGSGGGSTLLKRGKLVYQVHCVRCHGPQGHGDGGDARSLRPPPRDFAVAHWRFGSSPEAIRRSTVQGIPGTAMFAWGGSLSAAELDAVVAYVQSLGPKSDRVQEETTPQGGSESPDRVEPLLKKAGFLPRIPREPAPSFAIQDLDGGAHSLEDFRGKLTLLVFWGTSCGPCVEDLPELERLAGAFSSRGLTVLPVCVDESNRVVVRQVVRQRVQRLDAYLNPDGTAPLRYDLPSLPAAALIDRSGRLLGTAQGRQPWGNDEVRQLLAACLGDS